MKRLHLFSLVCLGLLLMGCSSASQETATATSRPATMTAIATTSALKPVTPSVTPETVAAATISNATEIPPTATEPPTPTATRPAPTPTPTVRVTSLSPPPTGRIVFLWDPNPIPEERGIGEIIEINLYLANPDTTPDEWHITAVTEIASQPAMSIEPAPDANKIAVVHYDDTNGDGVVDPQRGVDVSNVYVYKIADGSFNRLTDNEWDSIAVSWLPDSQTLAYPQLNEVFLAELDDTSPHELLVTFSGSVSRLAWSPDGRQLAALHAPSSSSSHPMNSTILDLFYPDTGELTTIVSNTGANAKMQWSSTSQWLAFTQVLGKGLSVVNANTLEIVELVPPNDRSFFEWSPDGQRLAFTHHSTLFLWDGNILNSTELASVDAIFTPAWSPDGSRIAVGFTESDRAGMLIIDPVNGYRQELNLDRVSHLIFWSPDGQWLLFLSGQGDPVGLYLVSNEGGEPYLFLETTGFRFPDDVYWLPDEVSAP